MSEIENNSWRLLLLTKSVVLKLINLATSFLVLSEYGAPFAYALFSTVKLRMVDLWLDLNQLENNLSGGGGGGNSHGGGGGGGNNGDGNGDGNNGVNGDSGDGDGATGPRDGRGSGRGARHQGPDTNNSNSGVPESEHPPVVMVNGGTINQDTVDLQLKEALSSEGFTWSLQSELERSTTLRQSLTNLGKNNGDV